MSYSRVLVTGGAGFIGSNLAISFKRDLEGITVIALDNLRRRGSELALDRLSSHGIQFLHGDIRNPEDIAQAGKFDLLIECSAEPSVSAGYNSSPGYVVNTNLTGTTHCLEAARKHSADVIFLSTSRVYPIGPLRNLPLGVKDDRLDIVPGQSGVGWSKHGIAEDFSLDGPRSLYGATKLASEILLAEYTHMYNVRSIVNRCGVVTGAWQMGKVDQGFVVLWAARHLYGGNLSYMGYGGHGHQVRDILHVDDLYNLLKKQLRQLDSISGKVFNVGGGFELSVSLAELTDLCATYSGNHVEITPNLNTHDADIPWYITDTRALHQSIAWQPEHSVSDIVKDILSWLTDNRHQLEPILGL